MSTSVMNTQILQTAFGEPQTVLRIHKQPLGTLASGRVRVQINASNINPSDILSIRGTGQYRHYHQPPRIPGFEACGIVSASLCPRFKAGQKVVLAGAGTWQNYYDAAPDNLFVVPDQLPDTYACQLYINALTAWIITTQITHLTPSDVVIINAGNSAIGHLFAQFSQSIGFTLLAVTSSSQHYPYANIVTLNAGDDLNQQIAQRHLPRPNVALDAIGGEIGAQLANTLQTNSRYINYGTLSLQLYNSRFFAQLKMKNIVFKTFFLRYWEEQVGKAVRRTQFNMMLSHLLDHDIKLNVAQRLPLENIQQAMMLALSPAPHRLGKIIFCP